MLYRLSLTACLFLFAEKVSAQEFRVLHWSIEQGLSQGINQKMINDSKGFLWITSYEGVNRFDGKNFRNLYASPKKKRPSAAPKPAGW